MRGGVRGSHPSRRGDSGSATVWVLALCALVWFVTVAALLLASVRADRQRAVTAADLAALAAARDATLGERHACASAGETAEANAAALRSCQLVGQASRVEVEVQTRMWPGGAVTAWARAGPVTAPRRPPTAGTPAPAATSTSGAPIRP